MLRILMLPFYLVAGLLLSIILLPLTLFSAHQLTKIEEEDEEFRKDIATRLNKELGCRVCYLCVEKGDLHCSPAPERAISTDNSECFLCNGTGLI